MPWSDCALTLVTPAYLGKFTGNQDSGTQIPFPVPSLRGALAYWLRTLAGAYLNDAATLLRVESAVFGAARNGTTGGPSAILLRAQRIPTSAARPSPGLAYLLGPGLTADDGPAARRVEARTTIPLRVRNNGSPVHGDLFLAALWALRTFGGIGARTRRGMGTVAVTGALNGFATRDFDTAWLRRDQATDLDAVLGCVANALPDLGIRARPWTAEQTPRWPCFANDTYRTEPPTSIPGTRDAASALAQVGEWLRAFRHERSVDPATPRPNPPRLPTTAGYRDIAKPFADRQHSHGRFVDGALGLPVVYTVHGYSESVTVEPLVDGKASRRASPLWLRVCNIDGAWRLRSLAFFAEWLPPSVPLQVKMEHRQSRTIDKPTQQEVQAELERWFSHLDTVGTSTSRDRR